MIKKESSIEFKNPNKRSLSPFMAEQLLYDYATKKLDPKSEQALSKAIEDSPALAKALDDIIYGMTYCHHLQNTRISEELLEQLKASITFKSKLKRYSNPRSWHKSLPWFYESLSISIIILVFALAIPWPKIVNYFDKKTKQTFFITEIPKDSTFNTHSESSQASPELSTVSYKAMGELHTVNPEFTANKLGAALPRLGASIEHHSLRKAMNGLIAPFFRVSIPKNQTEALLKELKSQGELTWTTPPAENETGSVIFGMELWLIKQEPRKGKAISKDSNEE